MAFLARAKRGSVKSKLRQFGSVPEGSERDDLVAATDAQYYGAQDTKQERKGHGFMGQVS